MGYLSSFVGFVSKKGDTYLPLFSTK